MQHPKEVVIHACYYVASMVRDNIGAHPDENPMLRNFRGHNTAMQAPESALRSPGRFSPCSHQRSSAEDHDCRSRSGFTSCSYILEWQFI